MSPNQCLIALCEGNKDAFNSLYEQTHQAVFNICLGILRDYHKAEDAMQETYITVYRKCAQYKPDTNAMAWIVTVAKSTALNKYRKDSKEVASDFEKFSNIACSRPTPEELADAPITQLALELLSEEEYQIITLCDVAGYKRREVAAMLQMPLPTVTWKRSKAINKLANKLKEQTQYE